MSKATFLIDIDGTIIRWSDDQPVENAVETINKWYDAGHRIIIITNRGSHLGDDAPERFKEKPTLRRLYELGLKYHEIIWNSPSPRIVINDDGAAAIDHPRDTRWNWSIAEAPEGCVCDGDGTCLWCLVEQGQFESAQECAAKYGSFGMKVWELQKLDSPVD
jgi:hypothetical protein